MPIKATNNFVFIIRDETEKEKGGLILPSSGKVKPDRGTIFSVGGCVPDLDIKRGKGQKAVFHKGIGFEIDIDGTTYLVLEANQILAVL